LETPSNMIEQVLPAMDYMDKIRSSRTGLGPNMAGLDVDELQNVTKGGQLAAMSSASLKIELVARLLAEGVKEIFTKIHGCLMRHQEGPMNLELSGKWVQVDPSQWRRRTKVNVNVGLGSGNREELRANLMMLGQAQGAVAQLGLVGPKQAYATFKQMAEALGFNQPEQFAMDPDSPEYQAHMQAMAQQPHPPDPKVQVAQIKAQTDQQMGQLDLKRDQIKAQSQQQIEQMRLQADQSKAQGQLEHAALSTHSDRQMQQKEQENAMALKLVQVIGAIIAQQIKGQQENAGELLRQDFESARALENE
jgi:hypothetical protein